MFLYFYLLEQAFLSALLRPTLARAFRERSFAPCRGLCAALLSSVKDVPEDALIRAVGNGLRFERVFWHALVGECLVHGAADIPRLPTAPQTWIALLAPEHCGQNHISREQFTPLEQALFGTRDLVFGAGHYRPDLAGFNDVADVRRLTGYLKAVDPEVWTTDDLAHLSWCAKETERVEELADARDWWPGFVELYHRAVDERLIVVCETI